MDKRHPWVAGELGLLALAGRRSRSRRPTGLPAPFARQIAGDWRAAAVRGSGWAARTSRRARWPTATRGPGDGAGDLRRLGARPAAAELRRACGPGAAHLPRGPRPSTRANRFGLTARQVEILGLLADGLTNAEIAARLSIAPKTAEHHVAAVLAKLDVTSRRAAVALASSERLIGQT